jgi:hypothetical protein
MSGTTGQTFYPQGSNLGNLRSRQNPLGMNTLAMFNNISKPLLLIGAGVIIAMAVVPLVKRYFRR